MHTCDIADIVETSGRNCLITLIKYYRLYYFLLILSIVFDLINILIVYFAIIFRTTSVTYIQIWYYYIISYTTGFNFAFHFVRNKIHNIQINLLVQILSLSYTFQSSIFLTKSKSNLSSEVMHFGISENLFSLNILLYTNSLQQNLTNLPFIIFANMVIPLYPFKVRSINGRKKIHGSIFSTIILISYSNEVVNIQDGVCCRQNSSLSTKYRELRW